MMQEWEDKDAGGRTSKTDWVGVVVIVVVLGIQYAKEIRACLTMIGW